MPIRPDLEHIVTFIHVVNLGSFRAAAEMMNVSKSVVSKHVSALEERLSVQLLRRSTRQLVVTEIGHRYYEQVKNIPDQITSAELDLHASQTEPQGALKIIAPSNLVSSLKDEAVAYFLGKYPKVTLDLELVRPVSGYVGHEFDIIILWKLNVNNFPDYNLVPVKLFDLTCGLYATPDYLEAHDMLRSPADLAKHNCFSSVGTRWPFRKEKGPVFEVDVTGNLLTTNEEMIRSAVLNDIGIAYSYPFIFKDDLAAGTVVPVLAEYTQLLVEFYAFYHPTAYVPLKIRAMVDELQEYYQSVQQEILGHARP